MCINGCVTVMISGFHRTPRRLGCHSPAVQTISQGNIQGPKVTQQANETKANSEVSVFALSTTCFGNLYHESLTSHMKFCIRYRCSALISVLYTVDFRSDTPAELWSYVGSSYSEHVYVSIPAICVVYQLITDSCLNHFCSTTQLCQRGLGSHNSVCLSHACFMTKPSNTLRIFRYHTKPQSLYFCNTNSGWSATPSSI